MKITIVGVGAMGSVYAGYLARAGHEVWAIDVWAEHLAAIAADGLRVEGPQGDFVAGTVRTGDRPEAAGASDLWVIGTKAADVPAVARAIRPLLTPDSVVMAFQNGLGAGERVAAEIPPEHVMVGIAEGFGSSVPQPGLVRHEGMRLIRIGELGGGPTARAERLAVTWADAGFHVKAFADIDSMVWEKFLCNVALSAPTTAFDCTVGELMADEQAWAIALGCVREAWAVGLAQGVTFGFDDPVRYVTEFASTIPGTSPSMRLDHLARRRSEIDVINGQVVELSREHGWSAPFNETLCAIIRRREQAFP